MRDVRADANAAEYYVVRFGELRFGDLVLETLASMGFDADVFALGTPIAPMIGTVVDIVDAKEDLVVRRIRDDVDEISATYERLRRDLRRCDVRTFECIWNLPQPAGT